jgi:hypothetical protein
MNGTNNKRLLIAIIAGSILGIFCILGMGIRLGFFGNEIFLASAWFNRLIMGIIIGLSGHINLSRRYNTSIRGAFFGLLISFAWFLSTGFRDFTGFLAGIIYGIIIDYVATRAENR